MGKHLRVVTTGQASALAPVTYLAGHDASPEARGESKAPADDAIRKLSAIVCLDVVGYSRMMERDEVGTDARFERFLSNIVRPSVVRHGGRVADLAGDGILVDFPTIAGALRCSTEVQDTLDKENQSLSPEDWLRVRIGVNLGEIIVRGARIAGHGVNIAARLQTLAPSGHVCVSEAVREGARAHPEFAFVSLGRCRVKNIARPLQAYTLLVPNQPGSPRRANSSPGWLQSLREHSLFATVVAAIAPAVRQHVPF
jgi:adenylate cyclase